METIKLVDDDEDLMLGFSIVVLDIKAPVLERRRLDGVICIAFRLLSALCLYAFG
jgi:hypothetical protein